MFRRVVSGVVMLLFLSSLAPAIKRTWQLADSAHGLTILALFEPQEWTFNPYSVNGVLLPPSAARWLLLNADFPYHSCSTEFSGCDISLVAWVGRSLMPASSDKRERALELLRHFISRGESVNQISQGLTPLHEAVLYGDMQYLNILLNAGADIHVRADDSAAPQRR